jgi:hypothetical protein
MTIQCCALCLGPPPGPDEAPPCGHPVHTRCLNPGVCCPHCGQSAAAGGQSVASICSSLTTALGNARDTGKVTRYVGAVVRLLGEDLQVAAEALIASGGKLALCAGLAALTEDPVATHDALKALRMLVEAGTRRPPPREPEGRELMTVQPAWRIARAWENMKDNKDVSSPDSGVCRGCLETSALNPRPPPPPCPVLGSTAMWSFPPALPEVTADHCIVVTGRSPGFGPHERADAA